MEIKTKRLLLRPWRSDDAEALYAQAKNPEIGPIAGWPVHTSVENSREIIETVLSEPEIYAVCRLEDGIPIGSIGLARGKSSNLNLPEDEAELGYWVGQSFWGQGFIPEASRALIQRAFFELNLRCLWCGYFNGNERSKRAQEKCGFVYHHTNENVYWRLTDQILTEHVTCLPRERGMAPICDADCGGCAATGGKPFGGDCAIAECCHRKRLAACTLCTEACGLKKTLIAEFNDLPIPDLPEVTELNALCGSYINLPLPLPGGQTAKFWDDKRVYLGNQLEKPGSERCYGLIADENCLMVCEYGCGGSDPALVYFQRRYPHAK